MYIKLWLEKLMNQLISVKLWFAGLITYLLLIDKINSNQYVTVISIILGLRGAYYIAGVVKDKVDINRGD